MYLGMVLIADVSAQFGARADRRITLDLDNGVKVNYGKFGDLLGEVKAVHGKKAEGA